MERSPHKDESAASRAVGSRLTSTLDAAPDLDAGFEDAVESLQQILSVIHAPPAIVGSASTSPETEADVQAPKVPEVSESPAKSSLAAKNVAYPDEREFDAPLAFLESVLQRMTQAKAAPVGDSLKSADLSRSVRDDRIETCSETSSETCSETCSKTCKQPCRELIAPTGGELLTLPSWVFSATAAEPRQTTTSDISTFDTGTDATLCQVPRERELMRAPVVFQQTSATMDAMFDDALKELALDPEIPQPCSAIPLPCRSVRPTPQADVSFTQIPQPCSASPLPCRSVRPQPLANVTPMQIRQPCSASPLPCRSERPKPLADVIVTCPPQDPELSPFKCRGCAFHSTPLDPELSPIMEPGFACQSPLLEPELSPIRDTCLRGAPPTPLVFDLTIHDDDDDLYFSPLKPANPTEQAVDENLKLSSELVGLLHTSSETIDPKLASDQENPLPAAGEIRAVAPTRSGKTLEKSPTSSPQAHRKSNKKFTMPRLVPQEILLQGPHKSRTIHPEFYKSPGRPSPTTGETRAVALARSSRVQNAMKMVRSESAKKVDHFCSQRLLSVAQLCSQHSIKVAHLCAQHAWICDMNRQASQNCPEVIEDFDMSYRWYQQFACDSDSFSEAMDALLQHEKHMAAVNKETLWNEKEAAEVKTAEAKAKALRLQELLASGERMKNALANCLAEARKVLEQLPAPVPRCEASPSAVKSAPSTPLIFDLTVDDDDDLGTFTEIPDSTTHLIGQVFDENVKLTSEQARLSPTTGDARAVTPVRFRRVRNTVKMLRSKSTKKNNYLCVRRLLSAVQLCSWHSIDTFHGNVEDAEANGEALRLRDLLAKGKQVKEALKLQDAPSRGTIQIGLPANCFAGATKVLEKLRAHASPVQVVPSAPESAPVGPIVFDLTANGDDDEDFPGSTTCTDLMEPVFDENLKLTSHQQARSLRSNGVTGAVSPTRSTRVKSAEAKAKVVRLEELQAKVEQMREALKQQEAVCERSSKKGLGENCPAEAAKALEKLRTYTPLCEAAPFVVESALAAPSRTQRLVEKASLGAKVALELESAPTAPSGIWRLLKKAMHFGSQHSLIYDANIPTVDPIQHEIITVEFTEVVKKLDFQVEWPLDKSAPIVVAVIPCGVADRQGIRSGDRILQLNCEETHGQSYKQLLPVFQHRPLTLKLERKAFDEKAVQKKAHEHSRQGVDSSEPPVSVYNFPWEY